MAPLQPTYRHRTFEASVPGQITLTYFAAAFFTLTLLTDWAYVQTIVVMWRDFSSWLLFAGLVSGGLGVLLWLIGLVIGRGLTHWTVVALNAAVLAAAFLNSLVHAGDGWTAIVPWGLGLSVATCVLMLASAALSRGARAHAA
ncbi:DUF2231 domain-containing protein [Tabrizicola sp. BL-A-41-H6]|uniref:DUF2231 domain-containing protein n=1 Tax=Tabrizicola sp. BL-A-41-H6 TaxID=3421107 RepID=UPI003D675418